MKNEQAKKEPSLRNLHAEVAMIQKTKNDVERLKKQGRYVIILNGEAKVTAFIYNPLSFANVIAVLAPTVVHGVHIPETLVMEIGISRTRPYKAIYKKTTKDGKKTERKFTLRRKVRDIKEGEFVACWRFLGSAFSSATFQRRSTWKPMSKVGWWVVKEGCHAIFERGVYFTVSKSDSLLYQQVLEEDLRCRRRYLRRSVRHISYWLSGLKYVTYPEKQMRSFSGVKKAVSLWKNMELTPRLGNEVLRLMHPKIRARLTYALEVFGLPVPINDHVEKDEKKHLVPFLKNSNIRIVRHEGVTQGRGCVVFEHFFKEKYREENNL